MVCIVKRPRVHGDHKEEMLCALSRCRGWKKNSKMTARKRKQYQLCIQTIRGWIFPRSFVHSVQDVDAARVFHNTTVSECCWDIAILLKLVWFMLKFHLGADNCLYANGNCPHYVSMCEENIIYNRNFEVRCGKIVTLWTPTRLQSDLFYVRNFLQ